MATEVRARRGRLARLAREPLLQFLAVALVLFAADYLLHGSARGTSGDAIVISAGRVQQIAESYELLTHRPPSRTELEALVADFVDEEIAYREAIAMGLDVDDTIVRRRMRQKLMFLVEDANASEEPDGAELAAWFRSHAEEYRLPRRIAFRQVLVSDDVHGDAAPAEAARLLEALQDGGDPAALGDATMLPAAMPLTTRQGVASLFGDAFADGLFASREDGWFGPIGSPFGAHDVRILDRESARGPALDEVRDKVRGDWIEAQRGAARAAFRARLRERYDVTIDWPAPYAGAALAHNRDRPP